ncbi:GntR family transcriptional regulator [Embleya scabrispora]|uniref:GntR family transcriptional regulator n=1 Tax=Embleya scabrispora TaxID=159449 RepID=UPI0003649940|nr:GntR family transcriptional regulator [Embleya scabrispora]MYS87438.1 FCD domain-containing protein [Streptomyces sp. SID5474]
MAREAGQQTRSDAVHDRIRADILGGRLRPGQRLKFPELSERYKVSTGAVREALLKLVAKNLVASEAHHGFRVTDVTPRGLADLTDVRTEIESLTLGRAIDQGDLAWQARVLAAHHTFEQTPRGNGDQPDRDWLIAHADFHTALLAGCANPRLRDLAASLREEAELYRRWSRPTPEDAHHWTDQAVDKAHRDLLDAVMTRDSQQADTILRRMISGTAGMILDTEPHE